MEAEWGPLEGRGAGGEGLCIVQPNLEENESLVEMPGIKFVGLQSLSWLILGMIQS